MSKYAQVNVKFGADISQFSTAMQNAAREMKKAGDQLKNVGQSMTMNLTAPIVALGAAALYSFGQIDSLKRGLISFSGSAQLAEEEFTKLREVAKLPGIGLEEAVRGSINLQAIGLSADDARKAMSAFGNAIATVGGGKENFDLAIRGFSQLTNASKPLQQDLYQIANQLPQVNKLMIDAFGTNRAEDLAKMGISGKQLADFLVVELEKLPKISGGIKNSFENMSDSVKISLASFGESIEKNFDISGKINQLSDWLKSLVKAFRDLDPNMQKFIISAVGIAAAIGPVLIALGGILKILPLVMTGFASLSLAAPYLLAISAAAVLIYSNWERVGKVIVDVYNYFVDLYNESIIVRTVLQSIATGLQIAFYGVKLIVQNLWDGIKMIAGGIYDIFATLGKGIKDLLTGNWSGLANMFSDLMGRLSKTFGDDSFHKNMERFKSDVMFASQIDTAKLEKKTFTSSAVTEEKKKEKDKPKGNDEGNKREYEAINVESKQLNKDVFEKGAEERNKVIETGWAGSTQSWAKGVEGFTSQMAIAKGKIMQGLEQLTSEINNMLKVALVDGIVDTFSQIGENLAMNEDPFKDVGKNLLNSLGKLMSLIGSALVAFGVNLALAETGIITLNPIQAIAAGAAMVAAGAFISATAKKGLKGGGSESTSYSGGSSSSQGNDLVLTTRLDGRDLLLSGQSTSYVKRR